MSEYVKTATLNGVATIEIARPEKKNALTVAMYQAMADALRAAAADAAVRAVLITGQPGIFTSGNDIEDFMPARPAQGGERHRGSSGVPVHEGAAGMRQAGGGGRHRGGHRHRHHDAAALRLRLRGRRRAAGDALRRPGPGAGVRVQPAGAAADGQRRPPRSCCWATRSPASRRWSAASPTPCCRPPRWCNHARRVAERFNALPPGAVREAKRLMRAPQREPILKVIADRRRRCSAQRLRSPEAMEAFQAFFQKRAGLLEVQLTPCPWR
jgi:hypothetical protein